MHWEKQSGHISKEWLLCLLLFQVFCKGTKQLEYCHVSCFHQLTDEAVKALAFHCHELTSVSIAGCPKVCMRTGTIVLGLLLQRNTQYFIQEFGLLPSISCYSSTVHSFNLKIRVSVQLVYILRLGSWVCLAFF